VTNPAAAGLEYYPVCELSVKRYLSGFPDAPVTFLLAGSFRIGKHDFYDPKGFVYKGPIKISNRIGLGGAIFSDINGPLSVSGFTISYAYHIPLNSSSGLALGMSFTGNYYSLNSSVLKPDQPGDSYLFSGNENKFKVNMNFGTFFFSNDYYAGISADRIVRDVSNVCEETRTRLSIFFISGYRIVRGRDIDLIQSIAIKKVENEKIAADITGKLYIKKMNWTTISYSTSGRLDFYFGLHLYRSLYAGYHYEILFNKMISYSYGSHEIFIGTYLGLNETHGSIKSADQFY
jgi:type IX secretion system PorP/SprF family membrane protein